MRMVGSGARICNPYSPAAMVLRVSFGPCMRGEPTQGCALQASQAGSVQCVSDSVPEVSIFTGA